MMQWLQLAVWLLLCATVSGREVRCDVGDGYRCWNSPTRSYVNCWGCRIDKKQTTDNEILIAPKHSNGTDVDIESVEFIGVDVTKMPKLINKNTNKQILQVRLEETKTRVLNAQFFGNATQYLVYFMSMNDNLSVEASAFQNFTELEALSLYYNGISSIAPDAFRGLHKLVRLGLDGNKLTAINENWFGDLANLERLYLRNNQITEVPDTAFENLANIKELHLEGNKIEIVTRRMFQHNQQLEEIFLRNNQIIVIQS